MIQGSRRRQRGKKLEDIMEILTEKILSEKQELIIRK